MKRFMVIAVVGASLVCSPRSEAILAADNASNAAYNDGWQSGDNGGFGFGAWSLTIGGNRFYYISDSRNNGNGLDDGVVGGTSGDGDINSSGDKAWGMTAFGGDTAEALRLLNAPLLIGHTISIDMDNGFIDGGATVGFGFQNNATAQNMFELFFVGGTSFYQWVDEGGAHTSTIGYTDEGLNLSLKRTGLDSYTATITTRGGATQTISGDFGGTLDPTDLDKIRLFNANAGGGTDHNAYWNFVTVIPEPSVAALLVSACLAVIWQRRRV